MYRILLSLSLIISFYALPANAEKFTWEKIAEDLELGKTEISEGLLRSGKIVMLRTTLTKYRPEVIIARNFDKQTSNVKFLANKSKAVAAINANFFDEQNEPLGLVIHRGQQLNPIHSGGRTLTGILKIGRNQLSIVHRNSFRPERVVEAIQAGPRLIVDNEPVAKLNKPSNRRAGVCIDAQNRFIIFTFIGNFLGITHEELQAFLLGKSIQCKDALNLDGGGSTQLYISDKIPNPIKKFKGIYLPGTDDVPVALALYPRSLTP
ncbi:MAG: phosphodiester glycosidase family protein [Bdellovibrionota bacterium]